MGYVKIWVHLVWSTKNREPKLIRESRRNIFSHIREYAEKKGIYSESSVNRVRDYIKETGRTSPKEFISARV